MLVNLLRLGSSCETKNSIPEVGSTYINISTVCLHSCHLVSGPIDESGNKKSANIFCVLLHDVSDISAYSKTPILSPESRWSSEPEGTTIFRALMSLSSE